MGTYILDSWTPFVITTMGEDWLYFSQPKYVYAHTTTQYLRDSPLIESFGAHTPMSQVCLAQCMRVLVMGETITAEHPEGDGTPPVPFLCGGLAGLDCKGRALCRFHMCELWECSWCSALLPAGEGGYCSSTCEQEAYLCWAREDLCVRCGAPWPDSTYCPDCDAEVRDEILACPKCGRKTHGPGEPCQDYDDIDTEHYDE